MKVTVAVLTGEQFSATSKGRKLDRITPYVRFTPIYVAQSKKRTVPSVTTECANKIGQYPTWDLPIDARSIIANVPRKSNNSEETWVRVELFHQINPKQGPNNSLDVLIGQAHINISSYVPYLKRYSAEDVKAEMIGSNGEVHGVLYLNLSLNSNKVSHTSLGTEGSTTTSSSSSSSGSSSSSSSSSSDKSSNRRSMGSSHSSSDSSPRIKRSRKRQNISNRQRPKRRSRSVTRAHKHRYGTKKESWKENRPNQKTEPSKPLKLCRETSATSHALQPSATTHAKSILPRVPLVSTKQGCLVIELVHVTCEPSKVFPCQKVFTIEARSKPRHSRRKMMELKQSMLDDSRWQPDKSTRQVCFDVAENGPFQLEMTVERTSLTDQSPKRWTASLDITGNLLQGGQRWSPSTSECVLTGGPSSGQITVKYLHWFDHHPSASVLQRVWRKWFLRHPRKILFRPKEPNASDDFMDSNAQVGDTPAPRKIRSSSTKATRAYDGVPFLVALAKHKLINSHPPPRNMRTEEINIEKEAVAKASPNQKESRRKLWENAMQTYNKAQHSTHDIEPLLGKLFNPISKGKDIDGLPNIGINFHEKAKCISSTIKSRKNHSKKSMMESLPEDQAVSTPSGGYATHTKSRDSPPTQRKKGRSKTMTMDEESKLVSRLGHGARTRVLNVEKKRLEKDYEFNNSKKMCPSCGAVQKFDEVLKRKNKCATCNRTYCHKVIWSKVAENFMKRNADAGKRNKGGRVSNSRHEGRKTSCQYSPLHATSSTSYQPSRPRSAPSSDSTKVESAEVVASKLPLAEHEIGTPIPKAPIAKHQTRSPPTKTRTTVSGVRVKISPMQIHEANPAIEQARRIVFERIR